MTRTEFISKLAATLEADPNELCEATVLSEMPNWDSMRLLEVVVLLDEQLGVDLNANVLSKCQTAGQLLALVGSNLSN